MGRKKGIDIRGDEQLLKMMLDYAKNEGRTEVLMSTLQRENQTLKALPSGSNYQQSFVDVLPPLPVPSLPPSNPPLMLPAASDSIPQQQPPTMQQFGVPPTVFDTRSQTVVRSPGTRINIKKWSVIGGSIVTGLGFAWVLLSTPVIPWLNNQFDGIEQQVQPTPEPAAPVPNEPSPTVPTDPADGGAESNEQPEETEPSTPSDTPAIERNEIESLYPPVAPVSI